MNITLIRPDRLFTTTLPDEVTGRHWVSDINDRQQARQLVCIEAVDDCWEMSGVGRVALLTEQTQLEPEGGYYPLTIDDSAEAVESVLLVESAESSGISYSKVGFTTDIHLVIGSDESSDLIFQNRYIAPAHAVLDYHNERFSIKAVGESIVYVNGYAIPANSEFALQFADRIFLMGLNIVIGKRFIAFNNPRGAVRLGTDPTQIMYRPQEYLPPDDDTADVNEPEPDFFFRSPRIRRDIVPKTIAVEDPPTREKPEETPTILKVGPAVGMALGSAMMGIFTVSSAIESGNIGRAIPTGCMMLVMILGAVLWPNLTRRYESKKADTNESNRRATYAAYLDKIRSTLAEETASQKEVFEENRITLEECLRWVNDIDRRLFERTAIQPDFMELRIGRGDTELMTTLSFPPERLTLEEDLLKSLLTELEARPRIVEDVPLSLALQKDFITGVVARADDSLPFMRGLIAQVATLHAPDEVKIVYFGDPANEVEWSFVKALPHIFDVGSQFRFLATNSSEAAEVSLRLERELIARREASSVQHAGDYGSYYLIVVANQALAKTTDVLESVSALRANLGFSVITFAEELRELPKECTCIINLDGKDGLIYDPKDSSGQQTAFTSDISLDASVAQRFAERLASIQFDDLAASSTLPTSLGFLEMFEVGKVEHLNVRTRWTDSNPVRTLGVPIGVDPQGFLSILDAHEDAHGPHGLLAGMTGSGKSETIITYILSLSINFRPDEVSFVLIDYKGGGLAGAFDNPRARLPHLSGTITNLDGAAIARSLISIQSELKRRQAMFNAARDLTSAGTMDIYKYQDLFRRAVVDEPCPHLFIIADEFAELKAQQPEFMEQLISAARIGRSLGVHLLLATQKPSGVVNDQIWSNARFKVCLKVADAADSREMLRVPDAAELTAAGRYYLQVGYNEYFALGQTGYSGATYRPSEHFEKKTDDSVVLISTTGRPIASVAPPKSQVLDTKTPEAVAVLDHLVQVAAAENLTAPRLWLDPISEELTFENLFASYPEAAANDKLYELAPLIGLYDDPYTQSQHLLRLPLSEEGNALIFGTAGSGKSSLLAAMLYSLIRDYSPEVLNAYILDFGAETLGAFRAAPQVGDVVFTGDDEKVVNLMRMLSAEIEERRKLLSSFGGSLELYNKAATNLADRLPYIVVAINNYDIFPELYERSVDDLLKLTRDGTRYGIFFVMACSRSGSVSYRMHPNFKQRLALRLNNTDEYVSIFGSVRDMVIPDAYARGLVRRDRTFEFQTALLTADPEVSEFEAITSAIEALGFLPTGSKARLIPSLPELVNPQLLSSYGVTRTAVPLGIAKNQFTLQVHNFQRAPALLITGDDEDRQVLFAEPFIEVLSTISDAHVTVLDPDTLLTPSHISTSGNLNILQEAHDINSFLVDYLASPKHSTAGEVAGEEVPESEQMGINSGLSKRNDYLFIVSLRSFIDCLDTTARALVDTFFKEGEYKNLGGLVISGDPSRFSPFSYESWYRELCSFSNGVWTSNGISNQTTLKITRLLPEFRESLADSFSWFIDRGNTVLIKHATN